MANLFIDQQDWEFDKLDAAVCLGAAKNIGFLNSHLHYNYSQSDSPAYLLIKGEYGVIFDTNNYERLTGPILLREMFPLTTGGLPDYSFFPLIPANTEYLNHKIVDSAVYLPQFKQKDDHMERQHVLLLFSGANYLAWRIDDHSKIGNGIFSISELKWAQEWTQLQTGIDAAIFTHHISDKGGIYLFKGNDYILFNLNTNSIEQTTPPYPHDMSQSGSFWRAWNNDLPKLDAGCNCFALNKDYLYMFKDNDYLIFDTSNYMRVIEISEIKTNFKLSSSFNPPIYDKIKLKLEEIECIRPQQNSIVTGALDFLVDNSLSIAYGVMPQPWSTITELGGNLVLDQIGKSTTFISNLKANVTSVFNTPDDLVVYVNDNRWKPSSGDYQMNAKDTMIVNDEMMEMDIANPTVWPKNVTNHTLKLELKEEDDFGQSQSLGIFTISDLDIWDTLDYYEPIHELIIVMAETVASNEEGAIYALKISIEFLNT